MCGRMSSQAHAPAPAKSRIAAEGDDTSKQAVSRAPLIRLEPRSRVILRHPSRVLKRFDMISSEVFRFSPFFACQEKTSVIRLLK